MIDRWAKIAKSRKILVVLIARWEVENFNRQVGDWKILKMWEKIENLIERWEIEKNL